MATPIPIAKPASTGMAGIVAFMLTDMIVENYECVTAEIRKVIENSGDNILSKERLIKFVAAVKSEMTGGTEGNAG